MKNLIGRTALFLCVVLLLQLCKNGEAWTTTGTPKLLSIPRSRLTTVGHPRGAVVYKHPRRPTWSFAEGSDGASRDAISEEAKILQERARKARETADEMERDLVSSKLKKLEGLLERQSQLSKADEKDVQDRIDSLKNYFNRTSTVVVATETERSELKQAVDEEKGKDKGDEDNGKSKDDKKEEILLLSELSEEERKMVESSKEQVMDILNFFNDALKESVGNNTELQGEDKEILKGLEELEVGLNGMFGDNITKDGLEFIKVAQSGLAWMANFTEDLGLNASFWEAMRSGFSDEIASGVEEYKNDPSYLEKLEQWKQTLPTKIIKNKQRLNEKDMEEFVQRVMLPLSNDVFRLQNTTAKRLYDMHILRGEAILKNGDDIIRRIDGQISEVGLKDKFQCYYVKDTTLALEQEPLDGDEIMRKLEERDDVNMINLMPMVIDVTERISSTAALIVTSAQVDLSPESDQEDRALLSFIALLSTAAFAVGCYTQDLNLFEQITTGVTSPIFLGILGIQMIHELGHFVAASFNKIEIAFPFAMIPSPSTGLLNTNTQLKSPPKNNDALFDFAASGPILGMAASWATLFAGLQMTSLAKASEIANLPHLPLEFFQLSELTSAAIETFLGTDVLLSLDPTSDLVAVHPLVVAGHVGILLNALNLLPSCATTDGGRMLSAVTTRYSAISGFFLGFANLFLLVQGFRGWGTCNLLILYSFATFLLHPTEVPCRNNVDPAGGIRLPLLVATTALSLVALSPSF